MAQSSVLSKHVDYSIYYEANIKLMVPNDLIVFKGALKKFQDQLTLLNTQFPSSFITGSIGFSCDGWKKVTTMPPPVGLVSANTFDYIPNTIQRDLFIHISGEQFDVVFKVAQDVLNYFSNTIKIEQEVHGFRRIEDRDLSGFIDGTLNPSIDSDRIKYGLVPEGQPHEYGSFAFIQRWVHHLESWNQQSVQYQQDTIGRMKKDSANIPVDQRPANSHVTRTQLIDEVGEKVKIVRQSLPYGLASGEKGLFFVGFSGRIHYLQLLLESMFGKRDGKQDLILKFTLPVMFIEASIKFKFPDDKKLFKDALKGFQDELDQLSVRYPESFITGSLCFSCDAWKKVTDLPMPDELKSSNTLTYIPNVNQREFFIHISSVTFDVAIKLAQNTLKNFGSIIKVEEEIHGYRRCEERDFSGFVDGTNNPQTVPDKSQVSLIPAGKPHENGSYVFVQRWVHHLENWDHQSLQYQQDSIGRLKKDSGRIPLEKRPTNSHVSRTQLLENNEKVRLNRASLPYGAASGEKGLFFVSFSYRFHFIELNLQSMFGKLDGQQDLVLRVSVPVSGSIYFCPSKEELLNM
ncbi:hypothetical protein DICPUDRAFT_153746 [Dictyostelium purpureum]|uniref:Dyp-type peroxidase family protein n=1 Tax=Dictyostelium purpureum TaxID=5786 RepID=F0ZPN5_DICPU|nr:uncharacterized protein DICPUDRAFT_153746 [Dictyostelium purpureum]EGC34092.1 hypothetical protein DICPUDRAFT_153746 [Dictyostelium purpureum]|eukprot:XP_003289385.1 hypothetical protein DICPUDRAFT_153746 [Dictyostelium purpureum]